MPGFNAGEIDATLTLSRTPFQEGLKQAKAEAEAFEGNKYAITLDAKDQPFRAAIDAARASAEEFAGLKASATLDANNNQFNEAMRVSKALGEDVGRRRPTIVLDADTGKADTKIAGALAVAKAAEKDAIRIKLDADKSLLDRKILEAQAELTKVKEFGGDIVLDGRIEPLLAKVRTAQAQVDKWKTQPASVELDAKIATAEANIARLYEEIQLFSERDYSVEVRALTDAAQAKLAALNAQAASLDRKRIELTVDASGAEKAAEGMSTFTKYALIAAGATPLISAGIVALPGVLSAAVVPAAAVAFGMDGIKEAVSGLAPELQQVAASSSSAFERGLEPAVRNVSMLMPVLNTGLAGTAVSLSGMAAGVTGVVSSSEGLARTQQVFAGVDQVVSSLTPGVALLTSNVMALSTAGLAGLVPLGGVLTQVGQEWQVVIADLSSSGTAQQAVAELVQVLGGVLDILPPLVQEGAQLMAVVGPPLAGALHLVADVLGFMSGPLGTVTTDVIALATAWKLASLAGNGFATLGGKIQSGWGSVSSTLSTAAASTATAGRSAETAAASTGKISGAFSKLGAALPFVGVALAGVAVAYDEVRSRADTLASGVLQGSQTYQDAVNAERNSIEKLILAHAPWLTSEAQANKIAYADAQARQNVNAQIEQQIAAMSPLQAAQAQVALAQGRMTDAVHQYGAASPQAAAATHDYQSALLDLQSAQSQAAISATNLGLSIEKASTHFGAAAVAQDQAQASAKLLADAYAKLADPLATAAQKVQAFSAAFQQASDAPRTFLENQIAASQALDKFAESAGKIPPAVVSMTGAIDGSTKAGRELGQNVLATAKAYDDLFGATVQNLQAQGVQTPAAIAQAGQSMVAYRQHLVDVAVQHGVAREKAQAMIDTYLHVPELISTQFQTPGMLEAVLAADGLKNKIEQLPGHKGIVVDTNSPAVIAQMEALGFKVTTLPGGKIEITANTDPATNSINQTVTFSNGQTGTMTLDANPDPATGKINGTLHFADGSTGTMTLDAHPDPATGKINATVRFADGSTGTIQLDGDPTKGRGKIDGTVRYADGSTGRINVDALTDAANRAIDYAARTRTATINVYEVLRSTVGSTAPGAGHALGAIVRPMEYGGMLGMAAGGGLGMGLTPMRSDVAQVVPPNSWRVIGDRMAGDEAFIPINSSARSQAILGQTAGEMGYSLVPRAAMSVARSVLGGDGASLGAVNLGPLAAGGASTGGTGIRSNADVVGAIRELRSDLQDLRRDVQDLQKAQGDVNIDARTYNPTAEPSSESQARALRTGAALVSLLPR